MKKLLAIALLSLSLAGCEQLELIRQAASVAVDSKISSQSIYIASNGFDAVEVTATNYLSLKRCPMQAPFCRNPKATKPITDAVRSGRVARNNAQQFLKDHPEATLGPKALYDAVIVSTNTVNEILDKYRAVK